MGVSFFLGLLLSIPLSVLANILTPLASKKLSERNDSRRQRQVHKDKAREELVKWFAAHPEILMIYLIRQAIGLVPGLGVATAGTCMVFFFRLNEIQYGESAFTYIVILLGFFWITFGMLSFLRSWAKLISLWGDVRRVSKWPARANLVPMMSELARSDVSESPVHAP